MGALDILQSAKGTVKNELGQLQSLKHVGRQLKEYEGLVSDLLSNRFVTLAVTIPVDSGGGGAAATTATGDSSNGGPADLSWEATEENGGGGGGSNGVANSGGDAGTATGGGGRVLSTGGDELRQDLELIVQGLLRLGEMERVLGVVQERVSEDLKLIIR